MSIDGALPPIDQSLVPASVRADGSKAVSTYDAALSFESMLDQQLTQALTDTLQPSDDSDDDSDDGTSMDASTSMMLQMLPQALSQDLASSGGLGLAPELYQSLTQSQGTP
jgi:Rod binding domain-containing protein